MLKFFTLGIKTSAVFLLTISVFAACASHPEQVPEIQVSALPPLRIESLKPQNVTIAIDCTRAINQQAGNTKQVVDVLKSALINALDRGGIKAVPRSKNQMTLFVEDCTEADKSDECVSMMLILKTPRYEVSAGGRSQNGYRRENGGSIAGFGDVSKAYQDDLQMAIEGLPSQVKKVLSQDSE